MHMCGHQTGNTQLYRCSVCSCSCCMDAHSLSCSAAQQHRSPHLPRSDASKSGVTLPTPCGTLGDCCCAAALTLHRVHRVHGLLRFFSFEDINCKTMTYLPHSCRRISMTSYGYDKLWPMGCVAHGILRALEAAEPQPGDLWCPCIVCCMCVAFVLHVCCMSMCVACAKQNHAWTYHQPSLCALCALH